VRHLTRLTPFGNLAPNISGPQSLKGIHMQGVKVKVRVQSKCISSTRS